MDMSGNAPSHSCKISMLWNWYTIDSCFISRSWHVTSRGMFAGSCIGVFLLVFFSQWLTRVSKEFDQLSMRKENAYDPAKITSPYSYWLCHQWMLRPGSTNFTDHLIRTVLYTIQWGVSYIIMLLFMYYNGYIIISCILGAFFGKLVFGFNEPVPDEMVSCCKE